MKPTLVQIGCWLLILALLVAGAGGIWLFGNTFAPQRNWGWGGVALYGSALAFAAILMRSRLVKS